MIRFLLFSIISISLALADLPPVKTYKTVNEYQSDIYFGNGILTTYEEAWIALRETLKPAILHDIYQDDKARMNKMHHFDVAYNYSFKDAKLPNGEKLGVAGGVLDLLESYEQLKNTSVGWEIFDLAVDLIEIVTRKRKGGNGELSKALRKEIFDYLVSKYVSKELATFISVKLTEKDLEKLKELGKYFTEEYLQNIHDRDLDRMVEQYKESIKAGHGVVIIAHSQGNLFAVEAAQKLKDDNSTEWMTDYIYHVSIASPATKFASKEHWLFSFDNDLVANLPGAVGPVTKNPIRYFDVIAKSVRPSTRTFRQLEWINSPPTNPDSPEGFWKMGSAPKPYTAKVEYDDLGITQEYTFEVVPDEWKFRQLEFHKFDYYMEKKLVDVYGYAGGKLIHVATTSKISKNAILQNIGKAIDAHKNNVSQYAIAKEVGCRCLEKYVKLRHKWDEDLTKSIEKEKIKKFSSEGKVYQVDGMYILAEYGGEKVEEVYRGNVCLVLKDGQGGILGEISADTRELKVPGGLFSAQLFWNEPAVQMQLESSLMDESVSGCGMAAAGSGELTLYDVYPGTYPVNVTDVEGYEELDENLSDTITLSIGTPGASRVDRLTITDKYQYPNLGVGGHVADIVIFREDPKEPPVPLLVPLGGGGEFSSYSYGGGGEGGGGGSFWGGSSTKIPKVVIKPPLCTPAKSCGCLPCKYKILTYLSQARLGPIAGADVRLYRARDEGKAQRELLYEGKTTTGTSVDEAGIIRLPVPYPQQPESEYSDEQREFLSRIEGYEGDFILEVSGGYDIDANDDLVTDSNFKRFNGVLHLILSKERLMQNDYKVNILTEIGYQLCKDLLGEYYDSRLVQERLDDIASRILIEKLYPDANASIGRDDLMWWIPSAHKNWLIKSYDRYLEPIVMKLYESEDIYSDAYEYVYAKPESISVPLSI